MRYLLLIYGPESRWQDELQDNSEAVMKPWFEYNDWLNEKGWYRAADPLQPTTTATTVRKGNGGVLTTDGPFAETKEQLGGYFLIECENLDEAIEAASRIPAVENGGSIEVRPIQEIPGLTS